MIARRNFIKISLITGTGLILGCNADSKKEASNNELFEPNAFLKISKDGSIIIMAKNPEIGQGVKTALPLIVAEELNVAWSQVTVEQAPYGKEYGGQWAGGSMSVNFNWDALRKAGATAKTMLLMAAANRWELEIDDCTAENATIVNNTNNEKFTYAELVEEAAQLEVPEDVKLKEAKDYTLIGKAYKVVDGLEIVTGKAVYGLDVCPENTLVAVIQRSPVFGGKVENYDDTEALKVAGVVQVIEVEPTEDKSQLRAGVAVLAKNTWAAMKGRDALKITWKNEEKDEQESTENLDRQFAENVEKEGEFLMVNDGFVGTAFKNADQMIEATYEVPFLYHATMEPMNYYADVKESGADLRGPTQVPGAVQRLADEIGGIEQDKNTVQQCRMGGGFGRRLNNDYAAEAIYLSKNAGVPVQVVWTREDDLHHDFYRPAGLYKVRAALQKKRLNAWHIHGTSTSRNLSRGDAENAWETELFPDGFPSGFIPHYKMEYTAVATNVPSGAWRGPGHNATCFVVQSMMDELAYAAGKDPVDFRLEVLGEEDKKSPYRDHGGPSYDSAKLKEVINKAVEVSNWYKAPPKGIYRGFACHFMFGSYVAEVIEISLDADDDFVLEKVIVVVNAGTIINRLGAIAQIEGGIIDGLNATIYGGVTIKDGQAVQGNFDTYPMLRFHESPLIETHLIESTETPQGMGETSLVPINAALCNAIFAATGQRLRKLPLRSV